MGTNTTQAQFPKTGLRLVCSMRAKNLPLWLYSKTGLENESMPHEGCRQNWSVVSQTPVPLGHFQPGTYLSFLQIIVQWLMRARPDTLRLHPGVLREGHK